MPLFKKGGKRNSEDAKQGLGLGYGHFKRYLFILMARLMEAYQTMPLPWWHALMVGIFGVFFGVFVGYILVSVLMPPIERIIVIPINETHIMRVRVPSP